jgi:hypothetical protein
MLAATWKSRVENAASEAELLGVVRDFVADLTPKDLERLPPICRPIDFQHPQDIVSYAVILVGHHCDGDGATHRLVTRLTAFFSAASLRLGEIERAG